jgi:hypothetical protein
MKKIEVILDDSVHSQLVVDSKKQRRSLKQHVLWLLEQHIQSCAVPTTQHDPDVLDEHITSFFETETLGLSKKDALQSYDSFVEENGTHWLVLDDFLEYLRNTAHVQARRDRVTQRLTKNGWFYVRLGEKDVLSGVVEDRVYYCHENFGVAE